jgi:hypothetical protein
VLLSRGENRDSRAALTHAPRALAFPSSFEHETHERSPQPSGVTIGKISFAWARLAKKNEGRPNPWAAFS